MKQITFTKKGIHFDIKGRGCSAFYFDLLHQPFSHTRGIRLFFRQIISGSKLILGEQK